MIAPEPLASCLSCGRERPAETLVVIAEGLVCEPCLDGRNRAEQRRDSIDDAWAAVEAFRGWTVRRLAWSEDDVGPGLWVASAAKPDQRLVAAAGATPDSALRRLATELAEVEP